jgi:phage repressor protein C with HTH and peptisase S24 domain
MTFLTLPVHFMSLVAENIKLARGGLSQEDFAKQLGVAKRTVVRWEKGETAPTSDDLLNISKVTGKAPEWFFASRSGGGEQRPLPVPAHERDRLARQYPDLAFIPMAILVSAGQGEIPFSIAIEDYVAYSREQLRRDLGGIDPKVLYLVTVTGNSMHPTLQPGDRVLIAEYQNEPIMDGTIYVWMHSLNGAVIKRVRWYKNGNLKLESDNRDDPRDFRIRKDDVHEWKCVGRVVRVEKSL